MNQIEKAEHFASLHVPGKPLVLYNIWDAGSARLIADAGAKAVATGSASVASAQGYKDGEKIPLALLETIAQRIADTVDVPVTIDFESGYAREPGKVAANVERILRAGAIGINFEDQIIGENALYPVETQAGRIAAIRQMADNLGIPLFINARTDLFLKQQDKSQHAGLVENALERAAAYTEAGANGFFIPGLADFDLIGKICNTVSLPVNVMMGRMEATIDEVASLGVGRLSYGPFPYLLTMKKFGELFEAVNSSYRH